MVVYISKMLLKKASLVIIDLKVDSSNCIYVKDTKIFIKNFCKFILNLIKVRLLQLPVL